MKPPSASAPTRRRVRAASDFQLIELQSEAGLSAQLLPSGALFALRHKHTLINQHLPGPAEEGLFRLWLRWRTDGRWQAAPLVGPQVAFRRLAPATQAVEWRSEPHPGWLVHVQLQVHPNANTWRWCVHLDGTAPPFDTGALLMVQDLGLTDEAAVRNNEAYTAHYIDLRPEPGDLGWSVLARQNQPTADGRHPWCAFAARPPATGYATDGSQVFGEDHRLTTRARAEREGLPSRRYQGELACAALSVPLPTPTGATVTFFGVFEGDHPATSAPADLDRVRHALALDWPEANTDSTLRVRLVPAPPLFVDAPWLHGHSPGPAQLDVWFPGQRRHLERGPEGDLWSFFTGDCGHVVLRAKEAQVPRPHGHILRSGDPAWIDPQQFGLTCYGAGVFASQAYFGNANLSRLLSVARHPLNVARAGGQRIFIRRGDRWHQLGVPSAWHVEPDQVTWWYQLDHDVLIRVQVWCSTRLPASFLALQVLSGRPCDFLVTHQLVGGAQEFDTPAMLVSHQDEGWLALEPGVSSPMRRALPGVAFVVAAAQIHPGTQVGGDAALYGGEDEHDGPYATLRLNGVVQAGVILAAGSEADEGLARLVAAAREEWAADVTAGAPRTPLAPQSAVHLRSERPDVCRINEILPWFAHNAWIHFSAPHGLEQAGGAAWGVRDVCQGSVEWLLASGDFATVRRLLQGVFSRQFPDGTWPQWFMHAPFEAIQASHSHGDVCFWPVKALCDYIEATNDLSLLSWVCPYSDPDGGATVDPTETLLTHCERMVAHVFSRFVAGTTLVNYGDGDWDDTLQPADPRMRTRLVSAWTVGLAYQTLRQLMQVCVRGGYRTLAERLERPLADMPTDFRRRLMPDGIITGFLWHEAGEDRFLLHPRDAATGIHYRLLPMTRGILAELLDQNEARRHLELIRKHLLYPDGVRLMDQPVRYQGGREQLFKRGESAAHVGREIGLQYVHAHLRYAEALAKMGEAEELWQALQVVNPVGLREWLPHAAPRQANVYFSSSDADFPDRDTAAARWGELREGRVSVRGGWRLYSSGPGLYVHKIRTALLGLRESWGDVIFDPVLPHALDGLVAATHLCGRPVTVRYHVGRRTSGPTQVRIDGQPVPGVAREPQPYRVGGLRISRLLLEPLLRTGSPVIEVEL